MRATAFAFVFVGVLTAAGCGLVYSYDGFQAAEPGVGGTGANGAGGSAAAAGTGAAGGTAGTGGTASGGHAGTGGTAAGGSGGDGCLVGSHCEAAFDPGVWRYTGDVLPNGTPCDKASVALSDRDAINNLNASTTCMWTCTGGGGPCQSTLTCSAAADCSTVLSQITVHTGDCLLMGGGSVACTASAVTGSWGNCTMSGSVTTNPASLPPASVGCFAATSLCAGGAGACVLSAADCIAADGAAGSCQGLDPYIHEKNFYQSVQDGRCSGISCAPVDCVADGGEDGPTVWKDPNCTNFPETLPADGPCPGQTESFLSVSLALHPTCPSPPGPVPSQGHATGAPMRWCCKTP